MTSPAPEDGPILSFEPGRNCWRVEQAERFAVIVDAADYFAIVRRAMMAARHSILIVGWDFDPRIKLLPDPDDEAPCELGAFIPWIAKRRPELQVRLLIWNMGAFKLLGRGLAALTVLRWRFARNITLRFDSQHPVGATHHQKLIVIDGALAFCGGIDMTGDRWDRSCHLDDEPGRRRPNGRPYDPWHDVTAAMTGPVATALSELARYRWQRAGGGALPQPEPPQREVWPDRLEPLFTDTDIAIARTQPTGDDGDAVREIEALFLDQIAAARHFLYADNQYFASRRIAEAIAKRLAEEDGPEFVLVNPVAADGWLQEEAMGTARVELMHALAKVDRYDRFRIYTPVTAGGTPIYVHAKLSIVDDRLLRVGSANMNNRSLGLDSECDVAVRSCDGPDPAIVALRERILGEHLGVEPAEIGAAFARSGSLIRMIEALAGEGKTLRRFEPPAINTVRRGIARSELLDPESTEERFEPLSKRGLFRRARFWRRRRQP